MTATDATQTLLTFVGGTLLDGMDIGPDDELLMTELLDSLSVTRLIAHIEQEFSLKIPAQDVVLDNMRSVSAIVGYLDRAHPAALAS